MSSSLTHVHTIGESDSMEFLIELAPELDTVIWEASARGRPQLRSWNDVPIPDERTSFDITAGVP